MDKEPTRKNLDVKFANAIKDKVIYTYNYESDEKLESDFHSCYNAMGSDDVVNAYIGICGMALGMSVKRKVIPKKEGNTVSVEETIAALGEKKVSGLFKAAVEEEPKAEPSNGVKDTKPKPNTSDLLTFKDTNQLYNVIMGLSFLLTKSSLSRGGLQERWDTLLETIKKIMGSAPDGKITMPNVSSLNNLTVATRTNAYILMNLNADDSVKTLSLAIVYNTIYASGLGIIDQIKQISEKYNKPPETIMALTANSLTEKSIARIVTWMNLYSGDERNFFMRAFDNDISNGLRPRDNVILTTILCFVNQDPTPDVEAFYITGVAQGSIASIMPKTGNQHEIERGAIEKDQISLCRDIGLDARKELEKIDHKTLSSVMLATYYKAGKITMEQVVESMKEKEEKMTPKHPLYKNYIKDKRKKKESLKNMIIESEDYCVIEDIIEEGSMTKLEVEGFLKITYGVDAEKFIASLKSGVYWELALSQNGGTNVKAKEQSSSVDQEEANNEEYEFE